MVSNALKQAYEQYLANAPKAPKGGVESGVENLGKINIQQPVESLGAGVQGLADIFSSPAGKQIAAGLAAQYGDTDLANAYMGQAETAGQQEQAQKAAYAQAQQKRMEDIGKVIQDEEARANQEKIAQIAAGTQAAGQQLNYAQALRDMKLKQGKEMGLKGEDLSKYIESPESIVRKEPRKIPVLGGKWLGNLFPKMAVTTPQSAEKEAYKQKLASSGREIKKG